MGKGMSPLIHSAMGWIVSLLFFCNDGFGLGWLTKVDVSLNKEDRLSKLLLLNEYNYLKPYKLLVLDMNTIQLWANYLY